MSKIEWTGDTLNPVVGCAKVSPGCKNCYAATMAGRLAAMGQEKYAAVVDGRRWNGGVQLVPEAMRKPLRRRKPQSYFVCSMSDLFHENVPFEYIAAVFGVMAATPQHTYQILTKRPARMREFFQWTEAAGRNAVHDGLCTLAVPCTLAVSDDGIQAIETYLAAAGGQWTEDEYAYDGRVTVVGYWAGCELPWPLPNVHLGVSAEDQQRADERVPVLLQCPAAVRFVSAEPLLGPLDLERWLWCEPAPSTAGPWRDPLGRRVGRPGGIGGQQITARRAGLLHWVIAGGESGPGARPPHPNWFRSVRDQCVHAGVPFFFKQWGEYRERNESPAAKRPAWHPKAKALTRTRYMYVTPDGKRDGVARCGSARMTRVGKKAAGRILDGRTWDELPG